ncbi:MAG TPA: sigma 54-interacting transcriptional regulator [Malonomonas sp.]
MEPKPDVLNAILSNMNEGVIFIDSNHVIQFCNQAAEKIRKVKADRIVGRSIFDIHPHRAHPQLSEMLINMKTGALPASHRIVHAQNRYFDNSYSSIRDEQGKFLGTLMVSRDITDQQRLAEEVNQLKNVLAIKEKGPPLVFKSPAIQRVLANLESVAPLDSTVLLTGESGTGKECIVDLIHQLSHRSSKPLIKVNCGALPESLIESELFGHAKGAFTGAYAENKGKFVSADGGTLFLDEIGDLPLAAQVKLLRVIQDKIVQPVGKQKEIEVDVRIVAATNCDLTKAVEEKRFREDLFYRLNVISINIPPLRERQEDIIPLAEGFLKFYARKMKKPLQQLSAPVKEILLNHPLPGNVRQLKHAMERAIALSKGDMLLPSDLPDNMVAKGQPTEVGLTLGQGNLKELLGRYEKEFILQALSFNEGKKIPTAETLGISRKTLWEKMQRYHIDEAAGA